MVGVWIYTDIPGAGKNWTLAVWAVNHKDADDHVKATNGGGRRIGKVSPGKVKADCGTVTERAREIIAAKI